MDDDTFRIGEALSDMLRNMGASTLSVGGEVMVHARRDDLAPEPPLVGRGDTVEVGDVINTEYWSDGTWRFEMGPVVLRSHVDDGSFLSGLSVVDDRDGQYAISHFAWVQRRVRLLPKGPGGEHHGQLDPSTDEGTHRIDERLAQVGYTRSRTNLDQGVVEAGKKTKHATFEGAKTTMCGTPAPATSTEAYHPGRDTNCRRCERTLQSVATSARTTLDLSSREYRSLLPRSRDKVGE